MNDITEQLKDIFVDRLKENELMSKHTHFRIGGPARWFVEVTGVEQIKHVMHIAKENNVPVFVFGGGSNMLVNDKGFEGVVLKLAMRDLQIEGTQVRAEAGVLSSTLARRTAEAGLDGLTWMISLPGTVGGAVRGNAGCFGGEVKDTLIQVDILRDGEFLELTNEQLKFGYRHSAIKDSQDIILAATFELKIGDKDSLAKELDENLEKRKCSQPFDAGSAGCWFKNYEIENDEDLQRLQEKLDIPIEMSKARRVSAGWLIDQLDMKGFSIGGAKISEKHGNFLVNTGGATADDIAQLAALVKTRARNEYGILLKEEIQYVGF